VYARATPAIKGDMILLTLKRKNPLRISSKTRNIHPIWETFFILSPHSIKGRSFQKTFENPNLLFPYDSS
jgi:hypothetical protein